MDNDIAVKRFLLKTVPPRMREYGAGNPRRGGVDVGQVLHVETGVARHLVVRHAGTKHTVEVVSARGWT